MLAVLDTSTKAICSPKYAMGNVKIQSARNKLHWSVGLVEDKDQEITDLKSYMINDSLNRGA